MNKTEHIYSNWISLATQYLNLHVKPFGILKKCNMHHLSIPQKTDCSLEAVYSKLIFFLAEQTFLSGLLKWKENQFFRHNNPSRKISSFCSLSFFQFILTTWTSNPKWLNNESLIKQYQEIDNLQKRYEVVKEKHIK